MAKRETGTAIVNGSNLGPAERDPETGTISMGPDVTYRARNPLSLVVHRAGEPPMSVSGERVYIACGLDLFEIRPHGEGGIAVRIEEHADRLALDLAMFPVGGNSVRLKGGLR